MGRGGREVPTVMNLSTDLRLPPGEFYSAKQPKDLIVLHHTVGGSAKSTFDYWRTDPQHIGTAYIVERDGTIFEVFPPECWAYHLGLKIAPMGVVDKRSIGIEIASEGALLERDGKYYAFGRMAEQTRFAAPNAEKDVFDCGIVWRDYRYFAKYTPAAIASVCKLVDDLLTRFAIPRQTPTAHTEADLAAYRNYKGVLTHCQLRTDKTDCHPGFDWDQLITACKLNLIGKAKPAASAAVVPPAVAKAAGSP
jgi:N-acetyl-anhydromuramyl-L-alanine amidase AmpD